MLYAAKRTRARRAQNSGPCPVAFADIDATMRPALELAKTEGKWVILASHHAADALTSNGGAFGTTQDDAVLPAAWKSFLGAYPNVILSMVGHSHEHRVRAIETSGGKKFWELMTSSIADYPHQFRTVEIFDQDNGWIMIRATAVDLDVKGDPVALEGRRAGVVDYTSGWTPAGGSGAQNERNVDLWIRKP
jgi:hypothetical protein